MLEQRIDPQTPEIVGSPFDVALSRATFSPAQWRATGAKLGSEVWVFLAGHELDDDGPGPVRRVDYIVPSNAAPRTVLAYSPVGASRSRNQRFLVTRVRASTNGASSLCQ